MTQNVLQLPEPGIFPPYILIAEIVSAEITGTPPDQLNLTIHLKNGQSFNAPATLQNVAHLKSLGIEVKNETTLPNLSDFAALTKAEVAKRMLRQPTSQGKNEGDKKSRPK